MVNSPAGEPKLEAICRRIPRVWKARDRMTKRASEWNTLQDAHSEFTRFEGIGGFGDMKSFAICATRDF